MGKAFRAYNPDQQLLLPPDLRRWLPEGHLALFVLDVVKQLDLSEIMAVYERGDGRGQPPYHPLMMVTLLVYAYCTGKPSSRRIERATYEEVAYRVMAGDQHPDHDSIAAFRQRHLPALARLFVQVLELCEAAGLVKLGHVALDGSKVKANASRHKAMSYERMCAKEREWEWEWDLIALTHNLLKLWRAQRYSLASPVMLGKLPDAEPPLCTHRASPLLSGSMCDRRFPEKHSLR